MLIGYSPFRIPFRKLEPKKKKKTKNADMKLEHVQFGFHEHKPDSLHVRNLAWFLFFFFKKNYNVSTIVSENVNKRMISNYFTK
jgi:hypothetical protein